MELAKEEVKRCMMTINFESRIATQIPADKPVARVYASHIVELLTEAL